MSDALTLRPARPDDAETIVRFNAAMAQETERLTLDPDRLRQGVAALLADLAKGFYLLAEQAGEVAGQMMITYEWSDWRNGNFWWIQSVYVRPESRRTGVFRRLYQHVAAEARSRPDVCGLRLYVEHENRRARNTYEQLGMKQTAYQMYEVDFVLAGR